MKLTTDQFKSLYQEHAAGVRQLLFFKCGKNDLDDLSQLTFVKVWQNLKNFRGDSQIKTWIYRIAWNTAFDYLRKKQLSGQEIEAEDLISPNTTQLKLEVQQLINRLECEQRDLCVLYYFEEFSVAEIAQILGVPEGTVKSRLHQLRSELKTHFSTQERG